LEREGPQGFVEVARRVASAFDLEDMGAIEQANEDGGGPPLREM